MSTAQRSRITIAEFLERMPSPQARRAAERLMDVAKENGGIIYLGDAGISIRYPQGPAWQYPISVAWLYPDERGWMRTREFSFGRQTQGKGPENLPTEVRQVLKSWSDSFAKDPCAVDVSSSGVDAWAISHEVAVKHIDELAERLKKVLVELKTIRLEDLADYNMAAMVMERVRRGEETVYSAAEVRSYLDMDC